MKRADAARAGAAKLMEVESALDTALSQAAELLGLLPNLRKDTGLSAVVGQDAVDSLGETLAHLLTARRTLIRAHADLQTVREKIGCRTVDVGVLDKTPDGDTPRTTGFVSIEGGRAA